MKKKYTKPEVEEVVMQDLMDVDLRISGNWSQGFGAKRNDNTWQEEEEDSVSNHNPWSGWDVKARSLWDE